MNRFSHIAVLMGGPSAEREVSLKSGRAVAGALREAGYSVTEVDVKEASLDLPSDVDAVFIALHGTFGEDGQVQALLRERGVPYTGSGVEASRLAFDKVASKQAFVEAGLPTPAYEQIGAVDQRTLPLPVVVKPARQGSSIGIHRVVNEEEWVAAYTDAAQYDEDVLVEAYIEGAELTVGVVGAMVLPVLEIRAPGGCYDFHAKYTAGVTEYLVPAPLPDGRAKAAQDLALAAYKALDCRGAARVDFRMTEPGDFYILEVNTIPGFTATSLLPKSAKAAGLSFTELCDRLIQMATVH